MPPGGSVVDATEPPRAHLATMSARWELTWTVEGAGEALVGGARVPMPVGVVVIVRQGESFAHGRASSSRTVSTRRASLVFDTTRALDEAGLPRWRPLPLDSVLTALLDHVMWLTESRPRRWKSTAAASLDYALSVFATGRSGVLTDETASLRVVARALDSIAANWFGSALPALSLRQMAHDAGIGTEQLRQAFAKEIGIGPVRTARLLRLNHAAQELRGAASIAEIALRSGFADEFHFSRAFRSETGMSPSAFRESPDAVFPIPDRLHRINGILLSPVLGNE
jgi:AraC-like DNA-binding protein